MDNRLRLAIIIISVLAGVGLIVGGFFWLRSRDIGQQPVMTGSTPSGSAASTTVQQPVTASQQSTIDALSKAPKDTDGDLLPDDQEAAKGTDPNNPDTDGDGLLDGAEVQNGTDPLKADTPRAEVQVPTTPAPTVSTKDTDRDGLTDEQEATLGTDPNKADTDGDGLSDYDEVVKYLTDPKKADTDGDGFSDGQEVKSGYNPLGPGKCTRATCIP